MSQKLDNGLYLLFSLSPDYLELHLFQQNFGSSYHTAGQSILGSSNHYLRPYREQDSDSDSFFGLDYKTLQSAPIRFTHYFQGKAYLVVHSVLDACGLEYVCVFDDDLLSQISSLILHSLVVYGSIWLLVCTCFCLLFFHSVYRPVESLLLQIPEHIQSNNTSNEYSHISNAIRQMSQEWIEANNIIDQQKTLLRDATLLQLTVGTINCSTYNNFFQFDVAEALDNYAVVVIRPRDITCWNPRNKNSNDQLSDDVKIRTAIRNLCTSQLEEFPTIALDHQIELVFIVSLKDPMLPRLQTLLRQCVKMVQSCFEIPVQIYYNGVYSGPEELNYAYHNALSTPDCISAHSSTKEIVLSDSQTIVNLELRMINLIRVENYSSALIIFKEITELIFSKQHIPVLSNMQLAGFISSTYSALLESNPDNSKKLAEFRLLSQPLEQLSRDKVDALWTSAFLSLCQPLDNYGTYSRQFQKILEFVKQNFRDDQLSLNTIAERFSISVATVSREFQKNMGMGFLDCLHRIRIEEAKRKIQSTQIPLKEIAAQVGYSNVLTMTRGFKKYEGSTPGSIRKPVY